MSIMAIVEPTLEHYRDFASRFEGGFRDYFLQGTLHGDDGKDYFFTYTLARMENRDFAQLEVSKEPLWFLTTPTAKTIQEGETPEIRIGGNRPVGSLKTEVSSTAVTATLDAFEARCSPPNYRFRCHGKDVSLDLTVAPLGLPFWYNQGREEGAQLTPSSLCRGIEFFGEAKGSLALGGKEIHVTGYCVHEHVILEHISWIEFGWHDWIWFVFDEIYGLLQHTHGGNYKDGGIFLRESKEYLVVRNLEIDHCQWAFSPVLRSHCPIGLKIRAHTDKGMLFVEGDVRRSQPWSKITKHGPVVHVCATEMEVIWRGSFTFDDGRRIELKDGIGANEVIASFNFAQAA